MPTKLIRSIGIERQSRMYEPPRTQGAKCRRK